jgi:cysteine synthase
MFSRTAVRAATRSVFSTQRLRYATAATSDPKHFSAKAVDMVNPHGIEISKAQRVAQNGFVDGVPSSSLPIITSSVH